MIKDSKPKEENLQFQINRKNEEKKKLIQLIEIQDQEL